MLVTYQNHAEERWQHLQQPAHSSRLHARFALLLAALDQGWFIEAPVYLRPRWSDGGPRFYHFILRRDIDSDPRMVSVPEAADVAHFLIAEGLSVVEGT